MATLGERIRESRAYLGLSQTKIAALCGSTQRSWVSYEKDQKVPGSKIITGLVRLGINANWVLAGEGSMTGGTAQPVDEELLTTIIEAVEEEEAEQGADLSPAKKAEIIAMAYRHFAADQEHDPELVARLFKLAS